MPVKYCPPAPENGKHPFGIALKFKNVNPGLNPLTDWRDYGDATKLELYPHGDEWGVLVERLGGLQVKLPVEDPLHPSGKLIPEWHRLTVHAKLDPNGTTLAIEIKLESALPDPVTGEPGAYSTRYQTSDSLELPHPTGWSPAEWDPIHDNAHQATCAVSLAPIGRTWTRPFIP